MTDHAALTARAEQLLQSARRCRCNACRAIWAPDAQQLISDLLDALAALVSLPPPATPETQT